MNEHLEEGFLILSSRVKYLIVLKVFVPNSYLLIIMHTNKLLIVVLQQRKQRRKCFSGLGLSTSKQSVYFNYLA
jgi:hypothetical protein